MASGGEALEDIFTKYAKESKEGKTITLENAEMWLKKVKVVDGKTITEADLEESFSKLKNKQLNYKEFMEYLEELAKHKKLNVSDLKCKLLSCGTPVIGTTTQGTFERLIDKLFNQNKEQALDDQN